MRSDPRFAELIAEFPELAARDVILEKEIYAHFGLLFSAFAVVEHALINFAVFNAVGMGMKNKTIRSRADWEQSFDQSFEKAKSQSLGNLIKLIKDIPEVDAELPKISAMKSDRDYFAHHFFRNEAAYFSSDARGWHLLLKLQDVRKNAEALDTRLKARLDAMQRRLGLPQPTEEQLHAVRTAFEGDAFTAASSGSVEFGWES